MMPRYMLDTDTCSYIMKRSHPLVLKRLQALPVSDVRMSVVTKAECSTASESRRGARRIPPRSPRSCRTRGLELDEDTARHYAEIRADLRDVAP